MASEKQSDNKETAAAPSSGGKLLPMLGLLALLGGTGVGAMAYMKMQQDPGSGRTVQRSAPLYMQLRPAFVVNLADTDVIRFLQTEIDMMTRVESAPEAVEQHMSAIRHALVSILSQQQFQQMQNPDGKLAVQADIQTAVNQILSENGVGDEVIESVFFTSFVMQ